MYFNDSGKYALAFRTEHVAKRIQLTFSNGESAGSALLEMPQDKVIGAAAIDQILSMTLLDLANLMLLPSTTFSGMEFGFKEREDAYVFVINFGGGHQQPNMISGEISSLGNYLVEIAIVDQKAVYEWEKEYQPLLKGPK